MTISRRQRLLLGGFQLPRVWWVIGGIVAPFIYALVINRRAFGLPPGWDSAITVSPASLTMVDLDFDIWELAKLPSSPEGGPSTHATSLYTIGLAILIAVLGPVMAFAVAHLLSVLLVAALTTATYLLARERASVPVSALASVAVGVMPLVIQQAADIYIDLPLAVVATFACWTTARRRFVSTAALVVLGVAIKTSGVFLLPLLLLARRDEKPMRRHLLHASFAGAVAMIPFAVVLLTTHRFAASSSLSSDLTLLRSALAIIVLTTDVFVLLSIYLLVLYGRIREGTLDRTTSTSVILVASFFAVHVATIMLSGTITILPRYYIVILPSVLVSLIPREQGPAATSVRTRTYGIALIVTFILFSLVNVRGDFYPDPDNDFYVIAERSTRAQDMLELSEVGTRELVATGLPILAERQVYFRLMYPEMGYVDSTPETVIPVFRSGASFGTFASGDSTNYPTELPPRFAMLIERRFSNPLLDMEDAALELGYEATRRGFDVEGFHSELIIASSRE